MILHSQLALKWHVAYTVEKASRHWDLFFVSPRTSPIWIASSRCTVRLFVGRKSTALSFGIRITKMVRKGSNPFRLPKITMEALQVRRNIARAIFVTNTLQRRIDCSIIMRTIDLNVRTRVLPNNSLLRLQFRRTNYCQHSALNRALRVFNRLASSYDFDVFRATIRRKLSVFIFFKKN